VHRQIDVLSKRPALEQALRETKLTRLTDVNIHRVIMYGGRDVPDAKRLKSLKDENAKLKKLLA
jgi:hypothetical protein